MKNSIPYSGVIWRRWAMVADVQESEVSSTSLRNAVKEIHAARGRPNWLLPETVEICIQVDTIHEKRGISSSSRFRENRQDERFIRAWVIACEFEWLSSHN